MMKLITGTRGSALRQFGVILLCLIAIIGFLFRGAIAPNRTVFSNDGPLGAISSQCGDMPSGLLAAWNDLNWLGSASTGAQPGLAALLGTIGKLFFSKVLAPFSLIFAGICAWVAFRQWKLSPLACFLGAIAVALNSDFLSVAAWGVAAQAIAFGYAYLALAALSDLSGPRGWIRLALAGFAVGFGVMEAYDIGAIFSMFVAAYAIFEAWTGEGSPRQKALRGGLRVAVMAVCAGFIAFHAIHGLVGTQIKGIAGTGQDEQTKAEKWDWATQWSMPKREVLTMIIPGLFGFRMDTPSSMSESEQERYNGGVYWGIIGRDPAWERYYESNGAGEPPRAMLRFTGGGQYAGILVVLVAAWAMFQAFRKKGSVFTLRQRKQVWFWGGVILVAMLLGFGRFAPFYQFFYALPYVSTIRNPAKFFHVVQWALLIVFAYGLHGLSQSCLETAGGTARGLLDQVKAWWGTASLFDRRWVRGMGLFLGVLLLGWLIYGASRDRLLDYLGQVGFGPAKAGEPNAMGEAIASFSIGQVGRTVLFYGLAMLLLVVVLSGYFRGARRRVAAVLLGALLVVDLGLANVPWVITYDWESKYQSNPVVDLMRQKPYEHRVTLLPFQTPQGLELLGELYRIEWTQHLFLYYNIQSLDVVQMSRAPVDYVSYESAFRMDGTVKSLPMLARRWELTNTRYILGAAGYLPRLNDQLDPGKGRFSIITNFDIVPKAGVKQATRLEDLTAVAKPDGAFALFDFKGALPRVKLYSHWQVSTNDEATLKMLPSEGFDPWQNVLVATPPADAPKEVVSLADGKAPAGTNAVEFTSYAPKDIVLKAESAGPTVLLLNDRYDPNWNVTVDGQQQALLRCNYLMRGVYLPAGTHRVEFKFQPPAKTFWVSLSAVGVAIGLCLVLALSRRPDDKLEDGKAHGQA